MMPHRCILFLYLFLTLIGKGQETELVVVDKPDSYLEYSVLKSDKKMNHGPWLKMDLRLGNLFLSETGYYANGKKNGLWETYYPHVNQLKSRGFYYNNLKDSLWNSFYPEEVPKRLVRQMTPEGEFLQIQDDNPVLMSAGSYRKGKQVGIWDFYNRDGSLCQQYDYTNNKLIYPEEHDVKQNKPVFIGGTGLRDLFLIDAFNLETFSKSINTYRYKEGGRLKVRFKVESSGNISEFSVLESNFKSEKFAKRVFETIKASEGQWHPAFKDGNPVSDYVMLVFRYDVVSKYRSNINGDYYTQTRNSSFHLEIEDVDPAE